MIDNYGFVLQRLSFASSAHLKRRKKLIDRYSSSERRTLAAWFSGYRIVSDCFSRVCASLTYRTCSCCLQFSKVSCRSRSQVPRYPRNCYFMHRSAFLYLLFLTTFRPTITHIFVNQNSQNAVSCLFHLGLILLWHCLNYSCSPMIRSDFNHPYLSSSS